MSAAQRHASRRSRCDGRAVAPSSKRRVGAVDGRHVEAAGQRRVAPETTREGVGVAELTEPEREPETIDSGGGGDSIIDDRLPPEPPWRGRGGGRPDRPPSWMRFLLYGLMLICAFIAGWLVGKVWARIDKAAWGNEPLFGTR